jgi:hypothetical protein
MENLKARGQEAENRGVASLKLDTMQGTMVPSNFDFEALFGDIIMCELIDEDENGNVWRDGVWVSQDVTKRLWRRGQVVLAGPDCRGVEVGDQVAYPSDRGIPLVSFNKKKYIFLNQERLFGKLKPITISK